MDREMDHEKQTAERVYHMVKKLMSLLLMMTLLTGIIPAFAESTDEVVLPEEEAFMDDDTASEAFMDDESEEEEYVFPDYSYEELTVGNPTPVEGHFFTELWGNNTSDMDVRKLITAYNLVTWDDEQGMYTMNPASVSGVVALDDSDGNRVYVINLYSDMYYSDGSQITAKDYAFSLLLSISPAIAQLGGKPLRDDYLVGYEEYMSETTSVLSGLRVVSDSELMITIRGEFLPFFYELGLLDCYPYPIHVIAPGCSVKDDGEGAYIDGPFSAELLQQTIMDQETGYLSHPSVVSGPYTLTSFDGETVEFEINPYFKGDANDELPMIQKLKLITVSNDTMIEQLKNGEVGLLNKVTRADSITQGSALLSTGYYGLSNYPRVGLTFISFCCEKPTVSSQTVRQAIASCLDKDQLISEYAGNYGLRVDGYYGLGQWMYQLMSGTMAYPVKEPEDSSAQAQKAYEEELAAWQELNLDNLKTWQLDTKAASTMLEKDGWKLNKEGIREKDIDGKTIELKLKLACPEGNTIITSMEKHFVPYLKEAGIELELISMNVNEMLGQFYHHTPRTVDMYYLGSNFDTIFDPASHFRPSVSGGLGWNFTNFEDETLYQIALDMRKTESGDLLNYCKKWVAFQERFTETMPVIPVYSNVYFDFYPTILHEYYPSETSTWSEAIIPAYLSDAEDLEEEEEELDEDEVVFDD